MNIAILGYGTVGSGVKEITKEKVIKILDLPVTGFRIPWPPH